MMLVDWFTYTRLDSAGAPALSSLILDTFQIDASTPALIPVSSQSIDVIGGFVSAVKDLASRCI